MSNDENEGNRLAQIRGVDDEAPRLSICILVYNQPDDVKRLLGSLSLQIVEGVEVIVRDDSTNDETQAVVDNFGRATWLHYHRGVKEGIDKTIIYLTSIARGRFIWWMGDDDFSPGAIQEVLHVIDTHPEVGFVWANYVLAGSGKMAVDLPESRLFSGRDEVLERCGSALGFISACVMRGDLARKALTEVEPYLGSTFVNLYIVLFVVSRSEPHFYLRGPVVVCHPASTQEIKAVTTKSGDINNRAFEVFGIWFFKILCAFDGFFDARVLRNVAKKSFGSTWRGVLVGWAGGWDTPKGKRIPLLKTFYGFPEAWLAFVLFLMPGWLNRLMYWGYKNIKRSLERPARV